MWPAMPRFAFACLILALAVLTALPAGAQTRGRASLGVAHTAT